MPFLRSGRLENKTKEKSQLELYHAPGSLIYNEARAKTGLASADGEKDNNKEASISSIADNLQPEVRDQIADLLAQELERVTTTMEAEEKELEDLRAKIKKQEAKIAQSKLTAKFIKERLEQWRPGEETE